MSLNIIQMSIHKRWFPWLGLFTLGKGAIAKAVFSVLGAVLLGITYPAVSQTLDLTPAEKKWIAEHPTLSLAFVPSWSPIAMLNKERQLSGIAGDYARILEERLGIRFNVTNEIPWSDVLKKARNQQIDVVMPLGSTPDRVNYLNFTEVLFDLPYVIITRAAYPAVGDIRDLAGKRVSVAKSFVAHEWLAKDHPELLLVPKENTQDALEAVAIGEVTAYVGDLASASFAIDNLGIGKLKVAGRASFTNQLRIGVRKDWPELISILNKGVATIDKNKRKDIWDNWVTLEQPGISPRNAYFMASAFVLIIIGILVVTNRRLHKAYISMEDKVRERTLELERDISKRTRAEEQLKEAQRIAHLGSWHMDLTTNQVFWSEELYKMYGFDPALPPPLYTESMKLFTPESWERLSAAIAQIAESGIPYELELETVQKDGSRGWMLALGELVADAHSAVIEIRGVAMDITKRKQAEIALQQLNASLSEQIKIEVARNMAQERLLIQQSRLAAMGEMIGNIAHQWRQPINALTLLLANIKDAYDYNDLTKEYLYTEVKTGQNIIQRMSRTIDDFRNFFKPNKEKQEFDACNGVEDAINMVRDSFKNNNVNIVFDRLDKSCSVVGHPNEFSQVVLNIMANAKEAIAGKKIAGQVQIRVETEGSQAVISIRNNGGCIPVDILPKIFDPYFTTKEKGTGIGLYMSKMIMEHMGGYITIHNIEDGIEALITLPRVIQS